NGKVVSATPGVRGTTNNSRCLTDPAKRAALATKFNADENAPAKQSGKIIYKFSLSEWLSHFKNQNFFSVSLNFKKDTMLRISTIFFIIICFVGCKDSSEKDKDASSKKMISNISEEKE